MRALPRPGILCPSMDRTSNRIWVTAGIIIAIAGSAIAQPASEPSKPAAPPVDSKVPAPDEPSASTRPTPGITRPLLKMDDKGQWVPVESPRAGSDEAVISEARRYIAGGDAARARELLDPWIRDNEASNGPMVPAAFLARGDAWTIDGDEFEALYDYEKIIRFFPGCGEFPIAVERELEIAVKYLRGEKRIWWLGLRWTDARDVGEELMIRVQERLPGSRVAERAGIELADYYYRQRDLSLASTAYELFAKNYPLSPYRVKALQRRIYASIGRYKGPRYDSSALIDARVLINRFMSLYPAQAQETGLDEALLTRIDESAGMQRLEVAAWYIVREDEPAARYTLMRLIKQYPKTAAAQKALVTLKERGWMRATKDEPKQPAATDGALGDKPAIVEPKP